MGGAVRSRASRVAPATAPGIRNTATNGTRKASASGTPKPRSASGGAQQGEPVRQLHAAALERHRGELLGEEVAGDAEADRRDHGLADDRDEAEGEEQHAVQRDAHEDPQAVPGGDPQLPPERQPGLGDVAALAAVDLLGERLVERLADQQRHRGEGDHREEQPEDEDQRGEEATEAGRARARTSRRRTASPRP